MHTYVNFKFLAKEFKINFMILVCKSDVETFLIRKISTYIRTTFTYKTR